MTGTVYSAESPTHGAVGRVTGPGVVGRGAIRAVKVSGVLDAQALLAVTDMNAGVVPAVRVIELVELVPLHPAPVTVHV